MLLRKNNFKLLFITNPPKNRKSNMKTKFKLKRLSDNKDFPLTETTVLVGRGRECQIIIENGHASRKHATIAIDDDQVVVSDLDSTNGTYLNGKRITGESLVKVGDVIKFDAESYSLQWFENPEATIYSSPLDRSSPINSKALYLDEEESDFDRTAFYSHSLLMDAVSGEQNGSIEHIESSNNSNYGSALNELVTKSRAKLQGETGLVLAFCYENSPPIVISIVFNGSKKMWSIGRKSNCDINIDIQCISEIHAFLNWQDGAWTIHDNDSTNGLWVGEERVSKTTLQEGMSVNLGTVEMISYLEQESDSGQQSIPA